MKPCADDAPCPCGQVVAMAKGKTQPLTFGQCCGRWLQTGVAAPDALCLMQSRYSAFVLEREAYLLATWHGSHRPAGVAFEPDIRWLGLEVRAYQQSDAHHATVEFVARSKRPGQAAVRLHERSRFVWEAGAPGEAARWLYVDAVA